MKIDIDVIHGEKQINEFMHICDVFEQSKQFGEYECYTVTGSNINISKLIMNFKNTFEKAGRNVIFIGINNIDGKIFNFPKPYIRPGISMISDGHQWYLLKDLLNLIGYKTEIDKNMRIIKATRVKKNNK